MKDLVSENCETSMKEIEDDTNKWKDILWSEIRIINIVKMYIVPKATCRCMQFLSKYQWHFSQNLKNNFKMCMVIQRLQIAKIILRKKNKARAITLTSNYRTKL